MSLSGTNSYMGDDPNTKIFNSPSANAPPDAEMKKFNFFGNDFLPDIILAEVDIPTQISNTVLPITAESSNNLELIENCVENTHVFDANKSEELPKIKENETEPKTNSIATENFSKHTPITSQKDLKSISINVNEITVKDEKKNTTRATLEIYNTQKINLNAKMFVLKFNHEKQEVKFVHDNKINATLSKNNKDVVFVDENGLIHMTAEQKELHGKNIALYSFSKKNISSAEHENIRKNFNPDNIFICTNEQFNILNDKLMKKTIETKEKKDEKHINSKDKEGHVIEKSDKSVGSLTVSTIDLIKNSIVGIFRASSRKMDSAKEEQAIQKRDQKKFREKKEMLEKEINKEITENINRKVQEKNKPKH